jgi:hypothetical protein
VSTSEAAEATIPSVQTSATRMRSRNDRSKVSDNPF